MLSAMPFSGTGRSGLLALLLVTSGGSLPKGSRPTYRMVQVACAKCDLNAQAMKLAPDAVVCRGLNSEDWKPVADCITSARNAKKPFVAFMSRHGIDSRIEASFVGTPAGEVRQLWYDSDPSGGCSPCNAVIFNSRCATFAVDEGPDRACAKESRYVLCSEASHRTLTLGEPMDASNLYCPSETFTYLSPGVCSKGPGAGLRTPLPNERISCSDECFMYCSISEDKLVHASYFEEAPTR